mgnify:CR=1 FL=1|tara:strand:- start:506 stop:949 length:444 start_codon:yes stop_codon:yes gene_type:complete
MSKIIQIGISKLNNQEILPIDTIVVVAGNGIKDDRFFKKNNDPKNQLSLIESENIDYYNKKYNTEFSYIEFRRNIITKDIELNDLVGKTLSIGKVMIYAHDLCRPCKHLQAKLGKDNIIKEFLRRGGLRCEILNSGEISIGDEIKVL